MYWRQHVWATLLAGGLTIGKLLWWGVSLREARARSVLVGKAPTTAWQSSILAGPRNTSVVFSQPRAARRWYEQACTRPHGWPRLPFLLCQRGRSFPSRVLSWGLLRVPHDTPRCAARPPQTHDRLFSRYRLFKVIGKSLPSSAPGMFRRRLVAQACLQY